MGGGAPAGDAEGTPVTRPLPDWQELLAYLEHWKTDYVDDGTAESLEAAEHASLIKRALERQIPWVGWPSDAAEKTLTITFTASEWRYILANLELEIPLSEELYGEADDIRELIEELSRQSGVTS